MNIKQLMVTFFIALLVGGEIGARVLTDKFVYSQGEKVRRLVENHLFGKFLQNLRLQP